MRMRRFKYRKKYPIHPILIGIYTLMCLLVMIFFMQVSKEDSENSIGTGLYQKDIKELKGSDNEQREAD